MKSGILEEMTIEEVRELQPNTAVVPIGSTEPHGPHLPYGSDTFLTRTVPEEAVRRAVRRGAKVICLPTLPIGNNVNFRRFPFALRIGVRTLMRVVEDIVEQLAADGIEKVVVVNDHGGNTDALRAALREIAGRDGSPFVCMVCPCDFSGGIESKLIKHPSDHAGEWETSMNLAIRPDLVKTDRLADNPFGKLSLPSLRETFFVRPWHLYVPRSAGGESRTASAETGRAILGASIEGLARFLVELSAAPRTPSFPYIEDSGAGSS
ncbi:MAG: creatininase family protein [Planctomycetota bacterium]|nr:creatininase family protein [Planctomycetota bacterium]